MSTMPSEAKEPKRERGRQRVAALMDAGAALFLEKGYDATTMTEIAARAGAAIGSLYQFFPSKEALAEALVVRYTERASAALERLAARAPAASPAGLADMLVDLMLELRADRAVTAALSNAVADVVERRKPVRYVFRGRIAAILRAANPRLEERPAANAASMIATVMKTVPLLADQDAETGPALIPQARLMLTLYIDQVIRG